MSEEKKNEILEEKLDPEELEAVSGGRKPPNTGCSKGESDPKYQNHHGNCSSAYWKEKCSATVENDSHCWSDDFCNRWSEKYTKLK